MPLQPRPRLASDWLRYTLSTAETTLVLGCRLALRARRNARRLSGSILQDLEMVGQRTSCAPVFNNTAATEVGAHHRDEVAVSFQVAVRRDAQRARDAAW